MRYLFILCSALFFLNSHAQIDLQTGSAQYSIPVFDYTDPKSGLSNSVVINYNSEQGIKLNQISSNIGLGWSLIAGGEIIRIQNGEPDDQYNTAAMAPYNDATLSDLIYHATIPTLYDTYIPNGYLYKNYDINYLPKQLAFQPRFNDNDDQQFRQSPKVDEDTEQDVFLLTMNGMSKSFKIGRNTFDVKYEDGSLLKTEITKETTSDRTLWQQNITTKITGFKITDENGLIYTFDSYDRDELMKTVLNAHTFIQEQQSAGKYEIDRWVLTSIKNPITNSSINFTYNTEEWKYISNVMGGYSTFTDNNSNATTTASNILGVSHSFRQVLSSISFPNQITVNFAYSTDSRLDIDGSHKLQDINILSNSQLIKKVHLDNQYFSGKSIVSGAGLSQPFSSLYSTYQTYQFLDKTKIQNAYNYRLTLVKAEITGKNSIPVVSSSFTYETGSTSGSSFDRVPSRFEFVWPMPLVNYLDLKWDYSLHFSKNPDLSANETSAKMGSLIKVDESTNKSIEYQYKLNINQKVSIVSPASYVLVDKITFTDKVTNTTSVKRYAYSGYGLDYPTNYAELCYINADESMSYTYKLYNETFRRHRNETTTSPSAFKLNLSTVVKFGKDIIKNGIIKAALTAITGNMYDVYLLIKTLYPLTAPGALDAFFYNLFGWGDDELSCTESTTGLAPTSYQNALPTQLANIEEFDIIAGNPVLARQYRYTKSQSSDVTPYTFPYPAIQRFKPGAIGNLSLIAYYNASGQTVYSKSFAYDYTSTTLDNNFLSVKYGPNHFYSDRKYEQPFNDGRIADNWISKASYNFITGRAFTNSATETVANSANSANYTATANYTYDAKNNQPNQVYTTASDGKIKGTNTYYAIDYWDTYTSNSALTKQKQNNLVNTPVASLSWYKASSTATSYNVTGIIITAYDATTLGVSSVKTAILPQPVVVTQADISAFDPYSTTGWLAGVSFTTVQQNTFDNNFLPVQSNFNDNSSVSSVVYDYNTYLPAAKIVNSTYNDVSYTSFESSNKDLLSYADAGVTKDPGISVTGNSYYKLSAGNITRSTVLSSTQKYTVTVWAKGGTVTVNSSSGTSIMAKNGWTLYTFSVTGTTSLTVSGTANIDEFRLYPQNAQMVSYTYDPLIGITSACDENNNLVYNEYDDAGRLSIVRNADKNIIKKMCYNNLYTSVACTDYGNRELSSCFNGPCSCAYISNGVCYTVPADTYHSTISQDDADAQAWAEINANGQTNANAHPSCTALSSQTVQYVNSTSDAMSITFYNRCTSKSTVFSLNANVNTATTITQLQGGTYDVTISGPHNHSYMVNNYTIASTTSATFSNMQFTNTTTFVMY